MLELFVFWRPWADGTVCLDTLQYFELNSANEFFKQLHANICHRFFSSRTRVDRRPANNMCGLQCLAIGNENTARK